MNKRILLLNGPSSSGKSTLARTFQERISKTKNEDFGIVSIDDFLEMSEKEAIYEDDVFAISSNLCWSALKMLNLRPGVIIDHVITSERIFCQLMNTLGSYGVCLIHVTCPLPELEKRERARQNRRLGSAKASFEYLFPKGGYDLTVDTFLLSPEECSLRIVELFGTR